MPQKYLLPDLIALCPFQWSKNPNYSLCRTEEFNSSRFFTDPSDQLSFRNCDFELLCAYVWPQSYVDYEKFKTCCDYMNLLFVIDDVSDRQPGKDAEDTANAFLDVMNSIDVADSQLARLSKE